MVRLMTIYWKVTSLLFISMLLLINQRPIGYITVFITPLLMVISIWFWVDLNDELADLPPWRPLPFTVRLWRWALSLFGILLGGLTFISLPCSRNLIGTKCTAWLEAPQDLHNYAEKIFGFLFGGTWNEPLAAFLGYLALVAYGAGILQWLLIRFPKHRRIAGDF